MLGFLFHEYYIFNQDHGDHLHGDLAWPYDTSIDSLRQDKHNVIKMGTLVKLGAKLLAKKAQSAQVTSYDLQELRCSNARVDSWIVGLIGTCWEHMV